MTRTSPRYHGIKIHFLTTQVLDTPKVNLAVGQYRASLIRYPHVGLNRAEAI